MSASFSMTRLLEMAKELQADPGKLSSYDWIVVSTSAGKDSQAMLDYVCERAEAEGVLDRVVAVHCDLGRVEWKGTRELAEKQAARYGVPCLIVWRRQGDLLQHIEQNGYWPKPDTRFCTSDHKRGQIMRAFTALSQATNTDNHIAPRDGDLLEQVAERGMWPSPAQRYCTSDQKRAQVHRIYTALVTGLSGKKPSKNQKKIRILSCQGMRAQESPKRAKLTPLKTDTRASNGRREVTNWLPIHSWSEDEVWTRIDASRTADLKHYAYALGMPRVSCCFCIFAPREALVLAGKHNPELLAEYVAIEERIGHKFKKELSMADIKAAVDMGEVPDAINAWDM